MYERFTDRARKVMQLANDEAMLFQHEYIGTEHILLGLIKEGSGVAAVVLNDFDVGLKRARVEIDKIVQSGQGDESGRKLPPTPHAKKIIEFAIDEARKFGHNYVGTEHLLLGLLRDQESLATQVLFNLGVNSVEMQEKLLQAIGQDVDKSLVVHNTTPRDVPLRVSKALKAVDDIHELLQQMNESAVARADFYWAALLRDQTDRLKKMSEFLLREGHRDS